MSFHVAIIPDGNRRWAKARGMQGSDGHRKAVQHPRMLRFIQAGKRLGITHLSFWAFSTENWKRPLPERKLLFALLTEFLHDLARIATDEQVRFRWIGRRERIPAALAQGLSALERSTAKHKAIHVQLCLDYGGRDELIRAVNAAVRAGRTVTEDGFQKLLDTRDLPDPDLVIRTSGEQRLSGFMPWQATYAELYFSKKLFPEFTTADLTKAVQEFKERKRRFGG